MRCGGCAPIVRCAPHSSCAEALGDFPEKTSQRLTRCLMWERFLSGLTGDTVEIPISVAVRNRSHKELLDGTRIFGNRLNPDLASRQTLPRLLDHRRIRLPIRDYPAV